MGNMTREISYLLVLMMICTSIHGVPAAIHTVGDSSGWSLGGSYGSWTSDKTFTVGDTLVFNYPSGHSVDEVSATDYKTCSIGNSINTDTSGATSVTLKTAGTHYFICGVPSHCAGGMKLSVNVVKAAGAAGGDSPSSIATSPPSTTISPPSTTEVPPPITGDGSTPAAGILTQPSSSAVHSPEVAVFFIVFAAVYTYFI